MLEQSAVDQQVSRTQDAIGKWKFQIIVIIIRLFLSVPLFSVSHNTKREEWQLQSHFHLSDFSPTVHRHNLSLRYSTQTNRIKRNSWSFTYSDMISLPLVPEQGFFFKRQKKRTSPTQLSHAYLQVTMRIHGSFIQHFLPPKRNYDSGPCLVEVNQTTPCSAPCMSIFWLVSQAALYASSRMC